MEWIYVGVGVIVFIVIVGILIGRWLKKQDEESLRMEAAYREYKIATGHDPTYDEHGRLRK